MKEFTVNHYTITLLYICTVIFITLLFFSCEDSIVDPKGVIGDGRILFIKFDGSITQICSIKPDGTDLRTIASHDMAGEYLYGGYFEASWSPDKSLIAIKGGPRESLEFHPLWLMDNEGNLIKRLTSNGSSPHWSNDGNEILFARRTHELSVLSDYYIINVHTLSKRIALIAEPPYWWGAVDWSWDGQYILTDEEYPSVDEEGEGYYTDREIIQLQLHGGDKIQLTDNDVQDGGAQWSPDETKIVYISGFYTTGSQIKLMNSDGSGEETLVDSLALYNTVCWSPDGDKIAYNKSEMEGYAKYAEGSDIFVIDMISREAEQLTNFAADSIIVYVQDWK